MTNTKDINLYETGSGGDIAIINGDVHLSESLFQTVYLALFGGNVEADTLGNEIDTQEREDYWANSLLFGQSTDKQMNSTTERTLSSVVLNSQGRLDIQRAVEVDLDFLNKVATFSVNVLILTVDSVSIEIVLQNPVNQTVEQLQFVWDNAKQDIIISKTI